MGKIKLLPLDDPTLSEKDRKRIKKLMRKEENRLVDFVWLIMFSVLVANVFIFPLFIWWDVSVFGF